MFSVGRFSVGKFLTSARVTLRSSSALATRATAVVSLVLVPSLSVLFQFGLGSDVSNPDVERVVIAASLLGVTLAVMGSVVGAAARDRFLGIFEQVFTESRFGGHYWLALASVATLLATPIAAVALVTQLVFSSTGFLTALIAVFGAALAGVGLGIFAAGIGIGLPDPYLGSTLANLIAPVLCGVVVPISHYPKWLATLAGFFPMTRTLNHDFDTAISLAEAATSAALEVGVAAAYAVGGIAAVRLAITRIRNGIKLDLL